jgi:hypothetical protein
MEKAPDIKVSEDYKASISDSYHDSIPVADVYKEREYRDFTRYPNAYNDNKKILYETSMGIGGLLTGY